VLWKKIVEQQVEQNPNIMKELTGLLRWRGAREGDVQRRGVGIHVGGGARLAIISKKRVQEGREGHQRDQMDRTKAQKGIVGKEKKGSKKGLLLTTKLTSGSTRRQELTYQHSTRSGGSRLSVGEKGHVTETAGVKGGKRRGLLTTPCARRYDQTEKHGSHSSVLEYRFRTLKGGPCNACINRGKEGEIRPPQGVTGIWFMVGQNSS